MSNPMEGNRMAEDKPTSAAEIAAARARQEVVFGKYPRREKPLAEAANDAPIPETPPQSAAPATLEKMFGSKKAESLLRGAAAHDEIERKKFPDAF